MREKFACIGMYQPLLSYIHVVDECHVFPPHDPTAGIRLSSVVYMGCANHTRSIVLFVHVAADQKGYAPEFHAYCMHKGP
jgi:hypothetical protein